MELYACGLNEAGNLNLPAVCHRWHILGKNPCEHNNHCKTPQDPFTCPRMVTKLTRCLSAERIRLLYPGVNYALLDVEGRLRIFGHELRSLVKSKLMDVASESDDNCHSDASDIVDYAHAGEIALLMKNGGLWKSTVARRLHESNQVLRHVPNKGRGLLCLSCNGTLTVVVQKSNPQRIMIFQDLRALEDWICDGDDKLILETFDLPSPVTQLVANVYYFTALTEDQEAFTWKNDQYTPKRKTKTPEKKPEPTSSQAAEVSEEEEEGPDMSAILDDLPTTSSEKEPSPKAPSYMKIPLPKVSKISAGGFITAAIADERLYLWRVSLGGDRNKDTPIVSSLGDLGSPAVQEILPDINGNTLRIKDLSIGKAHIIVLTADGSLFSVGRGWHGELGIGDRLFELEVDEKDGHHYDFEDAFGFAETWRKMDTEGLLGESMEWVSVIAGDQTTFALARRKE